MPRFCSNCHKLMPDVQVNNSGGEDSVSDKYCPDCFGLINEFAESYHNKKYERDVAENPSLKLFPFKKVRPGQKELIEEIHSVLETGKHLVAHAPTGLGKTVAVLTPGLDYAIKNNKKLFFLTSRHTQHRIAIETLQAIKDRHGGDFSVVDIISKHRMCPRTTEFRAVSYSIFNEICKLEIAQHKCRYYTKNNKKALKELKQKIWHADELMKYSEMKGLCPYRLAMELGSEAQVIICDYNYIFSDINETILPKLGVDLSDMIVVVDEAHNLPDRIRSHQSFELVPERLVGIIRPLKNRDKYLGRLMGDIVAMLGASLENIPLEKYTLLPKAGLLTKLDAILHSSLDKPMTVKMFKEYLLEQTLDMEANSTIRSYLINLVRFLDCWESFDESSIRYVDGTGEMPKFVVKTLDPAIFAGPIFEEIHSGILMSGTLYPPKMHAEILGLDLSNTEFGNYQSPFPIENRLVSIDKNVTTAYSQRNMDMYFKIAAQIHNILSCVPGNIAVFFTSYDLLNSIKTLMDQHPLDKSILVEKRALSPADKSGILKKLKTHNGTEGNGAVLLGVMGGSLAEGVDYPKGLLSGIIVVGIPLPPPSVELDALGSYYTQKFGRSNSDDYCSILPAMNKVLQAAGRSIRSETDKSLIVFMDNRFNMNKYQKYFPDEYRITEISDVADACRRFF